MHYMNENWESYPCASTNRFEWISFRDDLVVDDLEGLPVTLMTVRVHSLAATMGGALSRCDERVFADVEQDCRAFSRLRDGVHVARMTTNGVRLLYFYVETTPEEVDALALALSKAYGYRIRTRLERDERWRVFREELYPSESEWDLIQTRRILSALERMGDDATQAREVTHMAAFESKREADAFCWWLGSMGYRFVEPECESRKRWVVSFSHRCALDLFEMTTRVVQVRARASAWCGEYEGWTSPVCPMK